MLHFLAPSKTLIAAAVLGVGIVPCCFAALSYRVSSTPTVECNCVAASEPTLAVATDQNAMQEVSLQETLDRLGYTVNVPLRYGGHKLLRWNDYRRSTHDDSLPATNFQGGKASRFTKVSEQGALEGSLDFGVMDEQGNRHALIKPDHHQNTYWISSEEGQSCTVALKGSTGFYINDTSHLMHTGPFSSLARANSDVAPHLLALPARKGGQWVNEGNNTGHWEGGTEADGVLLCWEDWQDFDYQDCVILAENVTPDKNEFRVDKNLIAIRP